MAEHIVPVDEPTQITVAPEIPAAEAPPQVAGSQTPAGPMPLTPEQQALIDEAIGRRLAAQREDLEAQRAEMERQIQARFEQEHASVLKLGKALQEQGLSPDQILQEYESKQLEEQAKAAGVSPDLYRKLADLERQNQALARRLAEVEAYPEVTALQGRPGFAEHAAQIRNLAQKAGISLEQAYRAIVPDDLRLQTAPPKAPAASSTATEQNVLRQVLARDSRGLPVSGGPPVMPKLNLRDMPEKDFDALQQRVLRGEKISSLG